MTVAFDSPDFMERLKAGGVADREARAITDAFSNATSQQLATKADLDSQRVTLTAAIEALRADFDTLHSAPTSGIEALSLELRLDLQAQKNRLLVSSGA